MEIDNIDAQILGLLDKEDFELRKLSEKTGLSPFVLRNRINKLFKAGIIRGPITPINPFTIGYGRKIFLEFKTNPNEPWIAEFLEKMENCETLDGIAGEYSLLASFRFKEDLQFNRFLSTIDELMSRSTFKKYRLVDVIRCYKEFNIIFEEEKDKELALDDVDYKMLDVLQNQALFTHELRPLTTTEISKILKRLGFTISQPAVHRRIKRLEDNRVILRRSMLVDYRKLKDQVKFVLRIKVNPVFCESIARDRLVFMDEIADLYRTGEDYGLLAITRARDVSAYNEFLVKLYESKNIIDTFTTLVLDERKRSVLLVKFPLRMLK